MSQHHDGILQPPLRPVTPEDRARLIKTGEIAWPPPDEDVSLEDVLQQVPPRPVITGPNPFNRDSRGGR